MKSTEGYCNMCSTVITRTAYRFTDRMHDDCPEAIQQLSKGHPYDMSTNIFDRLPQVFCDVKPDDGHEYLRMLGRTGNARVYKYVRKDYVNDVANMSNYKAFMSSANGSGQFGEALTPPVLGRPMEGSTETFISIGSFNNEDEAVALMRYISCKFTRAMLGVSKTTQHLTPDTWKFVPLQDFTLQSDINWLKSTREVDQQLYAKYGLDADEIEFIETHVKEMS